MGTLIFSVLVLSLAVSVVINKIQSDKYKKVKNEAESLGESSASYAQKLAEANRKIYELQKNLAKRTPIQDPTTGKFIRKTATV